MDKSEGIIDRITDETSWAIPEEILAVSPATIPGQFPKEAPQGLTVENFEHNPEGIPAGILRGIPGEIS